VLRLMRSHDGTDLFVEVLDGAGSTGSVWLSHATGFNGACWAPLIESIRSEVGRIVVWDHRGHGRSNAVPMPVSWWDMGNDVVLLLDQIGPGPGPVIGVGHSMGGAAVVMAEITRRGSFDALVLVEPILLGEPTRRTDYPLADVVRKRRRVFESRERARLNFGRKAPFSHWHPAAVDGYVSAGLREDGDTFVLACAPDFEAEVYDAAHAHGAFVLLDQVQAPSVVMMGEEADTYGLDWAQQIVRAMPTAELSVVAGGDHFIPMSHPNLVAREIRRALRVVSELTVDS
jgi:pimeloyl-ACP methyl ester carboxylesterase